jgi:hypothetical protein
VVDPPTGGAKSDEADFAERRNTCG